MSIEKDIENLLMRAIEKNRALKKIPQIILDTPKFKNFGDYSSNIALVLGQRMGKPSLEIAHNIQEALQEELSRSSLSKQIEKIEVKGPGFLNFFLNKSCLYEILIEIRKKRKNFGRVKLGKGRKVHLEFVSANPTGPLNVAHARQAAFGDTLAKLLEFSGYKVNREYYLNDEGVQIDLLGESLRANYLTLLGIPTKFPTSGYRGKYIDDLAGQFLQKYGRRFIKQNEERLSFFSRFAYSEILREIKKDLKLFGVNYDSWFSQKKLNKSGRILKALELLKKKGFLYQKEGAWWLATTKFGDDKDRVVIKSDSKFTYISPDIAYHQTKYRRKFCKMINVWGPDHHGYIPRLKAAIQALGYDARRLSVLIVQLVSLSSADKIIPMSTRLGQYTSLHDIIQAVGKDAARFFFLMRKRNSHLRFDLELAKKQSLENPVYYIQYAHARTLNILKFAKTAKIQLVNCNRNLDLSLLNQPEESSLIQRLGKFPSVVEFCTLNLEPHRITTYLQDLAKDFHHYYEKHKVVTKNLALTCARLVLVDAARVVLKNGLSLLTISAPEKM